MEVKLAFAAGLFCVVFSMLGSSQDIPDGIVYTEVKKSLVNGTTGILRCRFKGLPNGVFWKKGTDPAKSPSIIIWSYGEKSGPRYKDGSCDIDENYSLVIRNVRNADAGRYICRVSNYKGILIYNYTDVMITNSAVRMEQSVAAQKGKVGVLPCQVNIRPRRISWVRGANDTLVSMDLSRSVAERSGPGYEEGLFNITSEYSLFINDVRILHEDSYFCEVTDFDTGLLFRNVTRLNVFALPLEPFPSIEECPREQQVLLSCTLSIASETTLTCEVRGYYPVIDLFFLHGSLRVDSLETRVWNNSDGTRNKRITIATNDSSETVFECVARGLVGEAESRTMTIHLIRSVQLTRVVVAVVVPVILVTTIIVIAVYVMKLRKRHLKRKYFKLRFVYKAKLRDFISYIELWTLVKYAREENLSNKLGRVLDKLIKDEEGSKTLQTDEDYYQEFCQWKAGYTGTCQREDFFNACRNARLKSAINRLQTYSNSTRALTADDLEHTLWNIAERDRIIELLEDLGVPHEQLEVLKGKEKREVVEGSMNILKQWSDVNSSGNQEVMLSLALETIKYTPSDKDFFRIPECQKRELEKNEIQAFLVPEITSRHCTELIDATMEFKKKNPLATAFCSSKNRDVWTDDIIEENRTVLFDSHQMIEDWWAEQNCSHYEKRCRLQCAANDPKRRTDDLDAPEESEEKWPADKKLEHIAKLLSKTEMKRLWEALHISYIQDDLTDEDKRFKAMCRWRHGITQLKQAEKFKVLSTAFKSIGFEGLLSRYKSRFIYKAELVDMALDLIMEDLRPFAHSLGIERTKFASYRQQFRASHLDRGTISLVLQMIDEFSVGNIRPDVCSILDKAGYPNVIKRFISASEPSYGELFAIATAATQDDEPEDGADTPESSGESKQARESANETDQTGHGSSSNGNEKAASHQTTPRSDATLAPTNVEETLDKDDDEESINTKDSGVSPKPTGDIKNKRKHAKSNTGGYRHMVDDLQRMLELNDEDIPDSNMTSVLTLLKIWKQRMCPGLLDHRLVLAEGVQKINKSHLVAAVINGKYHNRETSFDFIKDMVNEMDEGRRISLRSLLEIKEKKKGKVMPSDAMSRRICPWVANWTKAMESSVKNKLNNVLSFTETSERHRDFNDKLVDNGFLDLAREIMNIEQERETDDSILRNVKDLAREIMNIEQERETDDSILTNAKNILGISVVENALRSIMRVP